jgi:hypothetical protein
MTSPSSVLELFQEHSSQSRDKAVRVGEAHSNERTFPGPWSAEKISQGYRVLDAKQRVLAYVVTADQDTKNQPEGLTLEEARRIARVISSLPDLIPEAPTGRTKQSWWQSIRGH